MREKEKERDLWGYVVKGFKIKLASEAGHLFKLTMPDLFQSLIFNKYSYSENIKTLRFNKHFINNINDCTK